MPIDTSVKGSPGWWLQREFNLLNDQSRQVRLHRLDGYRNGNAPLPEGAQNARDAFVAFQRKARSNFGALITSATSNRMTPVGFQTARDSDVTGDAAVGDLWQRAGLDVECKTVHETMLALSEAYVIVGGVDDETKAPLITAEKPETMVGEKDPGNPRRLRAALKVMYDDADGEYRAYLYLPGSATNSGNAEVWVAAQPYGAPMSAGELAAMWRPATPVVAFSSRAWDWVPDRSGELDHPFLPVVRFDNKDCVGEYEHHTDILDRINHEILNRMTIATHQAFRQRAIKGLPLVWPADHPLAGEMIDYTGLFTAHPAAVWQLPESAEMWESGSLDLQPILSAVKDDVQHLSAVTETPMHVLAPDSANQSAEGASLSREGLVFKVEDRIARTGHPWARVASLALLATGDTERADLAKLKTLWAPASRLSLSEKAASDALAVNTIPRRSRLVYIWGFSPAEADRIMVEVADEQLQQQLQAQALAEAAAAGQAAGAPAGGQASGAAAKAGNAVNGQGGKTRATAIRKPATPVTGAAVLPKNIDPEGEPGFAGG